MTDYRATAEYFHDRAADTLSAGDEPMYTNHAMQRAHYYLLAAINDEQREQAKLLRALLAARSAPSPPSDASWEPKGLREHLCQQQTFAPDERTRWTIEILIDLLDTHRPIGNDGKHGERHTDTCGCEDR